MGWFGRILGGPLGDYIEDKICGTDDEDEDEDENIVVRKYKKFQKYTIGRGFKIPGSSGPIVTRLPLDTENQHGRGLIETIFSDSVKPVVGSIVCCDLTPALEHTGIYVGRRRIIHRDGDGFLARVTPEEFIDRLGGFNTAINIHVACDSDGEPIGDADIAGAAREAMKIARHRKGYNLLTKNCHQFCRYCINGESSGSLATCSFRSLEGLMRRRLGFKTWRRWDFE